MKAIKQKRKKNTPQKTTFSLGRARIFPEKLSEKMCTRQSRKVIWDMINTLFLTLKLSNLLLLLSFNTRKHNVIGVIGRLSVKPRCYWL